MSPTTLNIRNDTMQYSYCGVPNHVFCCEINLQQCIHDYHCTVTLMISVMYTSKVNYKLIHFALSFIF